MAPSTEDGGKAPKFLNYICGKHHNFHQNTQQTTVKNTVNTLFSENDNRTTTRSTLKSCFKHENLFCNLFSQKININFMYCQYITIPIVVNKICIILQFEIKINFNNISEL